MKFDLTVESNEDLEYFKTLFLRNVGVEQNVYDFHLDDVLVRVQVAGLDGAQMITVGFFSIEKDGSCTSKTQFCPLADIRYDKFKIIKKVWGWNASCAWGSFTHSAEDVDYAFNVLHEILHIVYKVNKLKAFI